MQTKITPNTDTYYAVFIDCIHRQKAVTVSKIIRRVWTASSLKITFSPRHYRVNSEFIRWSRYFFVEVVKLWIWNDTYSSREAWKARIGLTNEHFMTFIKNTEIATVFNLLFQGSKAKLREITMSNNSIKLTLK